jgi:hypothetical protein
MGVYLHVFLKAEMLQSTPWTMDLRMINFFSVMGISVSMGCGLPVVDITPLLSFKVNV